MTDEFKLRRDAEAASRAQALADDETLQGAFSALESAYTSAWRRTHIDDTAGREKLFLAINVVGKVRDHLSNIIANGKLAQRELEELQRAAERADPSDC